MAGKLTAQTALTTVTTDDLLYIVNDPGGTPASRKVTFANLIASIIADADDGELLFKSSDAIASITPAANIPALTDNGGGTADGTVASQAAPTTLTDSTGLSGTHDDTLAATTVPADLTGGESPTEAEHNALLAVIRVMAQNQSDVAQKIIELVTLATTARNNLKEVTTQLNLVIAAIEAAKVTAAA